MGGFKDLFDNLFAPGEMIQFFLYFSNELKAPTSEHNQFHSSYPAPFIVALDQSALKTCGIYKDANYFCLKQVKQRTSYYQISLNLFILQIFFQ